MRYASHEKLRIVRYASHEKLRIVRFFFACRAFFLKITLCSFSCEKSIVRFFFAGEKILVRSKSYGYPFRAKHFRAFFLKTTLYSFSCVFLLQVNASHEYLFTRAKHSYVFSKDHGM